jgi:hypothetical protein
MAMSLPIMVQDIAPDSTFATVAATKPAMSVHHLRLSYYHDQSVFPAN